MGGAVAAEVEALCGLCRSFLGPCKSLKSVIDQHDVDSGASGSSCIVGSAFDLLHAMDADPSAATILLELIDAQVAACGSGVTWLLVLLGQVLGACRRLAADGAPLQHVLSGLSAGVRVCEQVR
jgi:hypothetical protein